MGLSASSSGVAISHMDRCVVFADGVVVYLNDSARGGMSLLDVAGGCCRPKVWPLFDHSDQKLHRMLDRTPVHTSAFVALHSHACSYYHALGEVWPKLYHARTWLRANHTVVILHCISSPALVEGFSALLGIDRSRFVMAHKQTPTPVLHAAVPHWVRDNTESLTALRDKMLQQVRRLNSGVSRRTCWLVVRRAAGRTLDNERALLNHDEMLHALRRVAPRHIEIVEYPPSGLSLLATASLWNQASVAVVPHGGGLANLIFMPPESTIIEIVESKRRGRVYGHLSEQFGHRYVPCIYREAGPMPQPLMAVLGIHSCLTLTGFSGVALFRPSSLCYLPPMRHSYHATEGKTALLDPASTPQPLDCFCSSGCFIPAVEPTLSVTDAALLACDRRQGSAPGRGLAATRQFPFCSACTLATLANARQRCWTQRQRLPSTCHNRLIYCSSLQLKSLLRLKCSSDAPC
jgi:hypothetical protein